MRRLIGVAAALLLCSCRVDAVVEVAVNTDGTGDITVTVTADGDVVAQAPGVVEDLAVDDVIAAGWSVDGPTEIDDGGLRLVLTHDFASVEEATALLRSLNGTGGPLQGVGLSRVVSDDSVTTSLTGSLRVDGGVGAFADPELLAAIGATPYADDIAAAGLRPDEAIGVQLLVELPGAIESTTAEGEGGTLSWSVPLDGTPIDLASSATADGGEGGGVWNAVSTLAFAALVGWCLLAAGFIAFVAIARRNRGARSRSSSLPR